MGLHWLRRSSMMLAVLTGFLIGNSLALKCHDCLGDVCSEEECYNLYEAYASVLKLKLVCQSTYDGTKIVSKTCTVGDKLVEFIGGEDRCANKLGSEIEEFGKESRKYFEDKGKEVTAEQQAALLKYINDHPPTTRQGQNETDPSKKTYKMCNCNTDLCNSNEADGKRKLGSNTSIIIQSGNHVAVISLALATLVYGFLGSQ